MVAEAKKRKMKKLRQICLQHQKILIFFATRVASNNIGQINELLLYK